MALIRIIYIILLICAGAFVVMYLDALSLILFLVVLILPVLLLLLTLFSRSLTKVDAELQKAVATKGEEAAFEITINNRSFVSLTSVKLNLSITNDFLGQTEDKEIYLSSRALTKQTTVYSVSSPHVGQVTVNCKNVVLYDYFKLFSFKIKINKSFKVSFLPEVLPTPVSIRPNAYLNSDSDVFSKAKSGDDPSEVFKIRDYVGGDKMNRIHWKLSTKTGTLMVKEFSLPLNTSIMLLLELNANKADSNFLSYMDTVIETTVCISSFLADSNIRHFIAWFDPGTMQYYKQEIKDRKDVYTTLGLIIASKSYDGSSSLDFYKDSGEEYSHVVYITPNVSSAVTEAIRNMGSLTFFTIMQAVVPGGTEAASTSGIHVLPVQADNVALSICNAVL